MKKQAENNVGFEVLEQTSDTIVYKRVIKAKNHNRKEKRKIEMTLPKVTLHFFDIDDIEKLNRIQSELADKYVIEKSNNRFVLNLKALKDFLTK